MRIAAKTRKHIGLIIANSQNMCTGEISLFLQYLTLFEHIIMFTISSISTVAEGCSNDIYDVVRSKVRGRAS